MRAVIIGGGKVGSYLARELDAAGHHVTVIESDRGRATQVGETTKALVLHGDATDIRLLEEADIRRSDWVLAVTGRDEDNIVASQLAATLGASRVLARLNDPKNRSTFDALKIPVVAVTDLMVQVISREVEVDVGEAVRVALLGRGQISLLEIEVPAGVEPQKVIDLSLPEHTILVSVMRGDDVVVPGPYTIIEGGDRVFAVTNVENETAVREELCKIP
ncbi:MAG: NAD(P)-binding domain-containing protein [Acidimicrobiia bacterium]|nr:NAD(P)-binding domain-containing protein [Acidimicrobiia bacterium]